MASKTEILKQLMEMSHWLGEEHRELVILGEGNTSAKVSGDTFYVKASGTQLGTISETGFVEISAPTVLEMLEGPPLTDEQIKCSLKAAMVKPSSPYLPSVETVLHAYLLSLPGVNFIGHTHPISVNSILCSKGWHDMTSGRLFPDEIVCCGITPAYVEYTDPGVPLARRLREVVSDYIKQCGTRPKAVLMQNHGLIAIGSTAKEVESVTAMWDKTARILLGTFHFGGPSYLNEGHVNRLYTRPDEEQRKKLIEGR